MCLFHFGSYKFTHSNKNANGDVAYNIVTIKIIRTIWINNNNNHNIKNRIVQNNEKVSKTTTLILIKATLKNK